MALEINSEECVDCGACMSECPYDAIRENDSGQCYVIEDLCRGGDDSCGGIGPPCAFICPLELFSVSVDDYIDPTYIFVYSNFTTASAQWNGTPFLDGGSTPGTTGGTDCSGCVWGMCQMMGWTYDFGNRSTSTILNDPHWSAVSNPLTGDVAVWPGHHMGFYFPNYYGPGQDAIYGATVHYNVTFVPLSWFSAAWGAPIIIRWKP